MGNEKRYVNKCLDENWISSGGEYVKRFEESFAKFCHARYAIACSSGTAALHLALLSLGLKPKDEVIIPTLTYIATANTVTYCGATPILADCSRDTWCVDPECVERLVTKKTKAIVPVHLYGHPADMDALKAVVGSSGICLVEDAAEAVGSLVKGQPVGSLGKMGAFSFFGNKTLTTGEGGMLVMEDEELYLKARQLWGQGQDLSRRYWFSIVGYNFRLNNVSAAIGLAQLEKVDWHVRRRMEVARAYKALLCDDNRFTFQQIRPWASHSYWMVSVVLHKRVKKERDEVMCKMASYGVETRPVFYPMHRLPPYKDLATAHYPVADYISQRGITLPTHALLSDVDIAEIVRVLKRSVE